jgi:hypothetical protein
LPAGATIVPAFSLRLGRDLRPATPIVFCRNILLQTVLVKDIMGTLRLC